MITVVLPSTLRVSDSNRLEIHVPVETVGELVESIDRRIPGVRDQLDDSVFNFAVNDEMLLHHAQTQPALPSAVSELPVPRDLEELLMQCLEKDPAKRPPSALALEARLARIHCPDTWTQDRARAWWDVHAPDVVAPATMS